MVRGSKHDSWLGEEMCGNQWQGIDRSQLLRSVRRHCFSQPIMVDSHGTEEIASGTLENSPQSVGMSSVNRLGV